MKRKSKKKTYNGKKKKFSKSRKKGSRKLSKVKKFKIKKRKNIKSKNKAKKRKNIKSKNKIKKKKRNFKKKVSHLKLKKNLKPLERIKKIRIIKFKLKKFKLYKVKLKKKKIIYFRKKVTNYVSASFQNSINFILTPFFKAYDNYFENKKIKKLKKIIAEEQEKEKKIKEEERLSLESKQKELRNEEKFARERSIDLKKFIRKEQAILRQEQAEKRRKFLEEIKLEKKIESFRKRELQEIMNLEKLALKEQREDYRPVEERLEQIKEKYRLIREQKIRQRVEALGVEITDADTKEDILQKEREYAAYRNTIESVLESFYRSANSLVFQLNKRYIPKHKSILRVIDRRYESNECFIRYDDSPDEDWLLLIYLEDSDAKKGKIIVENKTNPEKNETRSFQTKEIFTYSDYLVDAMTAHIDRERRKKAN
tara:strand:+ start:2413 stop:3690 length:1278 start_codon:yes stop_codon:yes gene_type:complete